MIFTCLPCSGSGSDSAQEGEEQHETRKERLRREAQSTQHLLTHLPRNPERRACVEGKLRARPARRRDPEATKRYEQWGELHLADHVVLNEDEKGHEGQ